VNRLFIGGDTGDHRASKFQTLHVEVNTALQADGREDLPEESGKRAPAKAKGADSVFDDKMDAAILLPAVGIVLEAEGPIFSETRHFNL
jgi:hypothetical protein